MKNYKYYIIVGLSCLLIGKYVLQPKQQVKEVIKVVEVEKNKKEEKRKTRTTIKETVGTDGSKVTETTVNEDVGIKETGTIKTKLNSSKVTSTGSGITLGLLAIKDVSAFSRPIEYGIVGVVPVFGRLSIVGTADTSKRVGLGVAIEF
jgi:hypothetical protein